MYVYFTCTSQVMRGYDIAYNLKGVCTTCWKMWEEQSILCYPTHESCFRMESIIYISTHSNYLFLEIKLTECQDLVYRAEIINIILGIIIKEGLII